MLFKFMKKAINPILILAVLFFAAGAANANLVVRQPSVKLMLKDGGVFSKGMVLENVSGSPLKVNVDLADTLDKEGKPISRACAKWIKLDETSFTIPAKSIKDLRFNVSVPKGAKGGYWTSIVYSYANGQMKGPGDITMNVKMHIESPINISILDTVRNDLSIGKLDVKYKNKILEIGVSVENTGNSFTDVRPTFIIINPEGNIVKPLKANTFKIYPDEEKQINYSGEMNIPKGKNSVVGIFDFEGDNVKTIKEEFIAN